MVISNIIGGLGNQMFQYAAGRALAVNSATDFKLDISEFEGYGLHQGFELGNVFSCPISIADQKSIKSILGWQEPKFIRRTLSRKSFSIFRKRSLIFEPNFNYWNGLEQNAGNAYLTGYWQSQRYFETIENLVRQDFTFKLPLSNENKILASRIQEVNSVSIHIRRGDYIHNPSANAVHGICTLDYYSKAISIFLKEVDAPQFFIFSDDIDWVRLNLEVPGSPTFIGHNVGKNSFVDMQLMSLCKHNIIANSSFSWWGAWLNPNPHKVVIAPSQWFKSLINTEDLIPLAWRRI
ncbi:alpha-1,2-fucosyltransferase [Polynucleobacter sp. MG-27-Goln-C1]|nr:alpha-1,2-fucosyltransferase [Polynucleobacter sp. MG-27-Goln-C1]